MRVSIRPRIRTAKAASWPLISGSLVGNNSSCLVDFIALADDDIHKGAICKLLANCWVTPA